MKSSITKKQIAASKRIAAEYVKSITDGLQAEGVGAQGVKMNLDDVMFGDFDFESSHAFRQLIYKTTVDLIKKNGFRP